jgi:hypothetical protein
MKRSVAELYREAGILEMLPDAQVPESPVPSLAPAERDCKATVLDSDSDEKTIADSESDAQKDHLFRLWETEPQTLQASPSESFDSQLSQNEDPNGHQCPHISDERHWSEDATCKNLRRRPWGSAASQPASGSPIDAHEILQPASEPASQPATQPADVKSYVGANGVCSQPASQAASQPAARRCKI